MRAVVVLRRLFLLCFDDCAHDTQPENGKGKYGNPCRADAHQAGAIAQRTDYQKHADHIDEEVCHVADPCECGAGLRPRFATFTGINHRHIVQKHFDSRLSSPQSMKEAADVASSVVLVLRRAPWESN